MFALIDCNSFFASCEKVFNPALKDEPVVVLSNNDGCVVARSKEAKKFKLPTGIPFYKVKPILEKNDVKIFSANFVLYGDLSHRIMTILREYSPQVEVYSIDEAFLNLDSLTLKDSTQYCVEIRKRIVQCTGIPVSIGIAPTKTLAKLCNHVAKHQSTGVFNWKESRNKDELLKSIPIEEVWGVGWRLTERLNREGIYNTLQLRDANEHWIRRGFSVTLLRTISELKEIGCIGMSTYEPRKQIVSSRSFGKSVDTLDQIKQAVADFTAMACETQRTEFCCQYNRGICAYK